MDFQAEGDQADGAGPGGQCDRGRPSGGGDAGRRAEGFAGLWAGGYVWRPSQGQEVLVVKAGADGEQPCVAGARGSLEVNLAPGEVYIHSGGGSIFISNGGVISMSGLVLVNGKPVLVKED